MNGSGLTERLTEEALEQRRQIHFYLDQISATQGGVARRGHFRF